MKQKLKSAIAMVLVLALCISIAPFSVLAAENPLYAPGTVVSDDGDNPPAGITGDSPPPGLVVEGDEEPFVPDTGASSENSGNSPTAVPMPTIAPESSGATPVPANTPPPDTFAVSDGEVVVAPAREQANVEGGTAAKVWPEQKGRAVGDRAQVRILYYCLSQDVGDTESIGYVTQMPAKAILYPSGEYVSAYCLAAHLPANDGVEYTWTDLTTDQQKVIGTIMALGFQYKGNTEWFGPSTENDQWAVTQFLIWASQNGYITKNKDDLITVDGVVDRDMAKIAAYAFSTDGMMAYYNDFKKRLEDFFKIPSFAAPKTGDAKTVLLRWNNDKFTTTLTDKNGVLPRFDFTKSLNGLSVSSAGNQLTITSTDPINGVMASSRVESERPPTDGAVVVWQTNGGAGGTGEQPIATYDSNGRKDPLSAYIAVATAGGTPGGDGTLIKTSEDGIVSGITFKITGSDGKSYTKTTNANGEISLKDLPVKTQIPLLDADGNPVIDPDTGEAVMQDGDVITYTATETTPIRYVEPASQTFTLDHGDVILEFDNVLKKWQVIVSKRDKETGTAQGDASLGGAQYGIYKDGTLLDTYTTGLTGRFTSEWYPCGSGYTLKEISPSTGYLLEAGSVAVGMEPGATTVEFNTTTQGVQEQVIKGKVAIVKHTDQGDTGIETPEKGAEFQIYLASSGSFEKAVETERDTITCDADGYAKSKDLPYGTYTVHQTKGWEGKEMVADFQVSIHENGKTYAFILNNRIFESLIQIMKRDKESGRMIPASGIGFKVRNADTGEYVVQKINYPTPMDISVYFTDVTGKLMMPEKLGYGNYELIEQNTAYGYVLDSTPVPFKVDGTQKTITVEKENMPQKGIINIEKQGEVFASVSESKGVYTPIFRMQNLPGAVFEIRAAENITTPDGTLRVPRGELVATLTTDAFGATASQELYLGKYNVKETKAPAGFVLSNVVHEVTLSYAGQTTEVTSAFLEVTDARQRASLDLEKHMEQNDDFQLGMNKEYENVKFSLYAAKELTAADGKIIPVDGLLETTGINENGHGDFTADMPFGSYYVQETATDEHYVTSDTKYPIEFAYAGQEKAVVHLHTNDDAKIENKLIRGSVDGKKVDETGVLLPGVLIGLFSAKETVFTKDTALLTVLTDASGAFSFPNVPLGKWIVREIQALDGFIPSTISFPVTVTADGQHFEIEIENTAIKGKIKLEKKGEIFSSVTEEQGKYTPVYKVEGLPGGVFEIRAEENIATSDGTLRLAKGELADTLTTDASGGAISCDLYPGKYSVKETKAPAGTVLDPIAKLITLEYDKQTLEMPDVFLGVVNARQKATLDLKKAWETDGPFQIGKSEEYKKIKFSLFAEKELTAADGKKIPANGLLEVIGIDEHGQGSFAADLPFGSYYVQETATDEHYITSDTKYPIEFAYAGQDKAVVHLHTNNDTTIENSLIRGSVDGKKVDDDKKEVAGALIGLFRPEEVKFTKETAIFTVLTGKDGRFRFEDIPFGTWTVREIQSPVGYLLSEKSYPVVVTRDGQSIQIQVENVHIKGKVRLEKKDAEFSGDKLSGALFTVFEDRNGNKKLDKEDPQIGELKETGKGIYTMEALPYGNYFAVESQAPEHFVPDLTPIYFEIREHGKCIDLAFKNEPKRGAIKLVKSSDDGKVAGIKFKISGWPHTGGYYSAELETDERGEILIENLREGEYTITEVKDASTARYLVSGEKTVTVVYGKTTGIKIYNKLIRGDLSVTKTDEDDPAIKLQGAAFAVYRDIDGDKKFNKEKDTLYGKLEDMKNGSYWLHGLPYGDYLLRETTAPEGFVLDEQYYPFAIRKDGEKLEFSNTKSGKTFVNRHITGELIILKKAKGTGAVLKGVPFVIKNEDGETVADGKTNEKGIVKFENLRYGKYTYQEISAPKGYVLDDKAYPFEITKEKQVIEVEMLNVPTAYTPSPTGDSRKHPIGAFVLMGVGAAGIAALVITRIRKKKRNAEKK